MKKILSGIGTLLVLFLLVIMSGDDESEDPNANVALNDNFAAASESGDNWLIYWYVCGSDLESNYGAASADINEMLQSEIPDNVRVLIEAGGSSKWHSAFISPERLNRYLFDSNGLHELDSMPDGDMGSSDTLANFLQFGRDNFDADHRVFIFWDHGGGSAFGVCYDERSENALRLNDIRSAFDSVFQASESNPPFELIGFDACLMASYDVANNLHGLTKYMTASEEVEPGNGWEYTGWLNSLGQDPRMSGAALGKAICDTYYSGCEDSWTEDMATLSVVDVQKMPQLRQAYDQFGLEALQKSAQNPQKFFSQLGRHAKKAENYGGNTDEQGFFDMVDLADLANRSKNILPNTSQNLINAIDDAVVYSIHGPYRTKGNGISGFYPYDGGEGFFDLYTEQDAASLVHKCLYYYQIYGVMPDEAQSLLAGATVGGNYRAVKPEQPVALFNLSDLEDKTVEIDSDGSAVVTLNEQQMDQLSSVHCNLVYIDPENDVILSLGSDANVIADWNTGVFKDNFQATWGMLDGHVVYVEITSEEDDYNIYSVPIKLNGMACNLQVVYDFKTEKYKVLGARKDVEKGEPADRNLIKIKAGDKITTMVNAMPISGENNDFTAYEVETFTVGNELTFEDQPLGDGEYGYCFEFVTPDNNSVISEMINFTVADGQITTSKVE
ncbi:MAG: clostripain [Selenomonadaceae bacterium]|nr:clostripain [Selenomonadaceae bacterium]